MKSIDELKKEHKAVLLTLAILEQMCFKIANNQQVDIKHIDELMEFLTIFVDKCHHGKEEKILFPALEGRGVKNSGGPVGAMLSEHELGRGFVKGMKNASAQKTVMTENDLKIFSENALAYKKLLTLHIDKEDNVLYPMGENVFSAEDDLRMLEAFEEIEKNEVGSGRHEQFHDMLHKLKKIYLDK